MRHTHQWTGVLLAGLFLAGCGRSGLPLNSNAQEIEFTFANANHGWIGEFADLPVNAGDMYLREYSPFKALPSELGTSNAPYIQSMNRSDDVFMYIKRRIAGLQANTVYSVRFEVRLATNIPAGQVGAGGAPGESVYVKVGVSATEPKPVVERGGTEAYYRFNLDKGNQSTGGHNAVVIGNIAKPDADTTDKFVFKDLTSTDAPLKLTTDANGKAWVFVGTDSGYEGLTQLYYTRIKITFNQY